MGDPINDYLQYVADREADAAYLPKCEECGEQLYDHYYEVYGECYCEACMDKLFRREL